MRRRSPAACARRWTRSMARVIFSPTTHPMLPPMKRASMEQMFTLRPASVPVAEIRASASEVAACMPSSRSPIRFRIDEIERIGGAQVGVESLVSAIEQQFQACGRIHADVRAAFRTHVPVGFQILLPDDLAAAFALEPQALGAQLARRIVDGRDLGRSGIFLLEPGHSNLTTLTRVSMLPQRGGARQPAIGASRLARAA